MANSLPPGQLFRRHVVVHYGRDVGLFSHGLFKGFVGLARPDLYAQCGYNATFAECKEKIGHAADNAFKSWPSGHSSIAMSGFLFPALFGQRLVKVKQLWVSVLFSAFIVFAFYLATTRVKDFRHHTDDVLAGFFIGSCSRSWFGTESTKGSSGR
jgi:membrane-associated phospholipid phosphatase